MNYLSFIIKSAFFDFSRSKAKTFLTSLGILIGVLSVVLLIAFGLGLKKYIQNQFESLGTNNLRLVPGKIINSGGGFRAGPGSLGGISFDEKDVISLSRLSDLELVVPVFSRSQNVSSDAKTEFTDIYHTSADVFPALNLSLTFGDLFTREDVEKRSKVVVIGPKLAEKLFETTDAATGRTIKIEKIAFKVIGVLGAKGGGFGGPDLDSFVYMPYKTGYIFNSDKKFVAMIIKAKTDTDLTVVKQQITDVLTKRYKEDQFSVIEQTDILNAISSIFNILNSVLVAIAAISLVVGGIGIMNIMYVTVTERTREIGIRRAIGARKIDILAHFLAESVILAVFGGMMGLGLAYLIVLAIQSLFPAYINIQSVLLALGVSSFIGILFGVFPARKAANLSPIDAIRYE